MKTIKIKHLAFLTLAFVANTADAQINDTLIIDYNNVSALINDGGYMFQNALNGTAGYEVPKGSGNNSIYVMAGWFGAMDSNAQLKVSFNKFDSDQIFAGPMADSIHYNSPTYLNQYDKSIWKVTELEIQDHITNYNQVGYVTPQSILDWPGNGDISIGVASELAPYVDVNGDLQYNPSDGDYPEIRGDEAVYVIMNDHYSDSTLTNYSMGIEIHLMVYQYLNGTFLDNATFLNYRVYNRSGVDYYDYRQALYADMDIGNYGDDFVGCDTLNHVGYTYNGDNFDEGVGGSPGYGANPPCQGMVCLSHDMSGFTYYTNSASYPYTDPNSQLECWNFMNGLWGNGSELVYGGAGYVGSAGATINPTNYAFSGFPGDSTGWSEFYPGSGASNPTGDRRGVMMIEEDNFLNNTSICSDFALVFDQSGTSNIDNVQNVIDIAGQLRNDYTAQNGYPCFSPQFNALNPIDPSVQFNLYPNPSNGSFTVDLPEVEGEVEIEIIDLTGRLIFSKTYFNTDKIQIDLDESNGMYVLKTKINSHSSIKRLILD
jgi:hypothetical protein